MTSHNDPDLRPICPKCGCPARHVRATVRVAVELNLNGTIGRIIRAAPVRDLQDATYECGLGHEWSGDAPPRKS